jgi:4-amino-4-deoxy-L-arabinose transferase-like glycosyltransferase
MSRRTAVLGFLAVLLAATRLGSLGHEVIDWDESTFVLMASRLLDGHLPYVDLFDNKPPLIFVLLAGSMALLGESLATVRLFGAACVLVTAILVMTIARRFVRPGPAAMAGVLTVAVHALDPGQHTSAELPATTLIMLATWALLFHRDRLGGAALAGLSISLAAMTRSNLGIVAPVFGLYLGIGGLLLGRPGIARWAVAAYTLAGLLPPVVIALVYWRAGALDVLVTSAVEVPLAYATEQMGMAQAAAEHLRLMGLFIHLYPILFGGFVVIAAAGFISLLAARPSQGSVSDRLVLGMMLTVVTVSMLQTGRAFAHYWLQVMPLAAVSAASLLDRLASRRRTMLVGPALVAAMVLAALWQTAPDTARFLVSREYRQNGRVLHDAAAAIAAVRQDGDAVWAVEDHLVLWYLHIPPVSRIAAHPSNLTLGPVVATLSAADYVSATEYSDVLASRPAFVVVDGALPDYLPDRAAVREILEREYALFFSRPGVDVWRRIGHRGWKG